MAAVSTTCALRCFSIGLPQPRRLLLATVALTAVAVGLRCGLPIYRRHVAIREIERLGGQAHIIPRAWPWLRDRIGNERVKVLLNEYEIVTLQGTQANDRTLSQLRWLANLRQLDLSRTQISDEGLVDLQSLTRLRDLDLRDTEVTTARVAELQRALPNTRIYKLGHPLVPAR